jgi:hypothetical protein
MFPDKPQGSSSRNAKLESLFVGTGGSSRDIVHEDVTTDDSVSYWGMNGLLLQLLLLLLVETSDSM